MSKYKFKDHDNYVRLFNQAIYEHSSLNEEGEGVIVLISKEHLEYDVYYKQKSDGRLRGEQFWLDIRKNPHTLAFIKKIFQLETGLET
jgi:hypothetical protein